MWYEDEYLCLTPVKSIRCLQNFDTNNLSRSEIISMGRPFSQYQLSKKSTASSSAVRVVVVGMIRMSELRRSVIVRIQSKLLSRGKGPIKSIETESQRSSGIGKGCRGPCGLEVGLLLRKHSAHEGM